jgi:serine/threonine-protein kinase
MAIVARTVHGLMAAAIAAVLGAGLGACGGGGGSPGATGAAAGTGTLAPSTATVLSLLAGSATESGSTDGTGSTARFNQPASIAVDPGGNVIVADRGNCAVRKITPVGAVSTLAGSPARCSSVDGTANVAGFNFLSAVAASRDGSVYLGDGLQIRAINTNGAVGTVATLDTGSAITAVDLPYFYVGGLAVDQVGNLYATNGAGTRKITPTGVTTVLDGAAGIDSLAGVLGSHGFAQRGIAVDAAGTVWIANSDTTVSTVDNTGKHTRIAGMSGGPGVSDGSGSTAHFGQLTALTPDGAGNAYAADAGNGLIRKITPAGIVTTVAGTVGASTLQLGNAPGALPGLVGVASDGKGTLYAISGNAIVKIVTQ